MKLINYVSSIFLILLLATNIQASDKNIVEVAVSSDNFKTLTTALTEAGLVDALKGDGPFTVFAPTDEAFAKLPSGALNKLLKDKEALKEVLLYHVVKGKVMSGDVVKISEAETLSGQKFNIKTNDEGVVINKSKVIKTDISASNGVIHVIDTVLLPPTADSQKTSKSAY